MGAAAGEGVALATGRGQPDLTNLEGLRPYLRDEHVVLLGLRARDEYRLDLQAAGLAFRPGVESDHVPREEVLRWAD